MTKPLNAFTAPATVRFARHEHAQITPSAGTKADRDALRALFESQQGVVDKFRRALHTR